MAIAALRRTLGGFHLFPRHGLRIGVLDTRIAEHMRMSANQFVIDGSDHVLERERTLLAGHLRVEDHLQQQVTELVLQVGEVAALDGLGHFVGFLDGVGRDTGEILLHVPRTAMLRIAQTRHDSEQGIELGERGFEPVEVWNRQSLALRRCQRGISQAKFSKAVARRQWQ